MISMVKMIIMVQIQIIYCVVKNDDDDVDDDDGDYGDDCHDDDYYDDNALADDDGDKW